MWWSIPPEDPETALGEKEDGAVLIEKLHTYLLQREQTASAPQKRIIADFRLALGTEYTTMKELAAVLGGHPASIGRKFRTLLEPFLLSVGLSWERLGPKERKRKRSACRADEIVSPGSKRSRGGCQPKRSAPHPPQDRPATEPTEPPEVVGHEEEQNLRNHFIVAKLKYRLSTAA